MEAEYACDANILTISCAERNKTIRIDSAYYGQYYGRACAEDCCAPYPEDCVESMEVHAPGDWYILTTTCNGEETCQLQNPGTDVLTCLAPYDSDYALVYYSCIPGRYFLYVYGGML